MPMIALLLLVGPDSGGQVQQIAHTFGVDWPHLLSQIISFSVVCVLLHRFAYKPVLKILDERRQQIAQGLADTEKIRAKRPQAGATGREIVLKANGQATKLIEEAHAAAGRVQDL